MNPGDLVHICNSITTHPWRITGLKTRDTEGVWVQVESTITGGRLWARPNILTQADPT
jgi:hypothetical protein